jgi:hypothetical protein
VEDEWYAQVILTVIDHAPLLADPRLARIVADALVACAPDAPGRLWGFVVLPETVRLVVGPTTDEALEPFVEQVKARASDRLLSVIRCADDDSLDMVLRYSPVWGGAIYQVWQAGSHRVAFWSEYKLSNAIYDLQQAPVTAEGWPYVWIGAEN